MRCAGRTAEALDLRVLPLPGHGDPLPRLRQRRLGAGRDHLPLGLGDHRHDADDQFVGLGHVGGDEPDAGLLEPEQEMGVAGSAGRAWRSGASPR